MPHRHVNAIGICLFFETSYVTKQTYSVGHGEPAQPPPPPKKFPNILPNMSMWSLVFLKINLH